MEHRQVVQRDPETSVPSRVHDSREGVAEGSGVSYRITEFLWLFWVRRRLISFIIVTGILLSLAYAMMLPAVYSSTTTLMPPDNSNSTSSLLGLLSSVGPAASVGSSLLGVKTPGAVFVGILGSRTIQENLVNRFDLVNHYRAHFDDRACAKLAANSQIVDDPKDGILRITVNADNPSLATNLSRAYVEELDRVVTHNSTSAARRERIFLEGRLQEVKQDLDNSSKALSQFSTKTRTIDVPSQGKAMVEAGLKLQAELMTARSELAALRQAYSGDNVRVRAATARIEELNREMNRISGPTDGSGSDAGSKESDYPSISQLPTLGLTYLDLERRVRVDEAVWEALTKQYEAAKVQEAKDIPTVRVLDPASVPRRKSSPVRSAVVALGGMLSLFIACVSVFAVAAWEGLDDEDRRKRVIKNIIISAREAYPWIHRMSPLKRFAFYLIQSK